MQFEMATNMGFSYGGLELKRQDLLPYGCEEKFLASHRAFQGADQEGKV